MSDRIERLADYLYAEYAGRDLDDRKDSIYAEHWIAFAEKALAYAGIKVPEEYHIDPFWTREHP